MRKAAAAHPREVDQIDMLMPWAYIFQEDAVRLWQDTDMAKHTTLAQQLDLEPRFLANLAHRRPIRQLVRVDMSAGRQPQTKLTMV